MSLSHLAPNTLTPVSHTTAKSPLQLHNRSAILIQFTSAALQVLIHEVTTKSSSSQSPARLSQSPPSFPVPVVDLIMAPSRSLAHSTHFATENIKTSALHSTRNFELDLWVSLRLPTIGQQLPTTLGVDAPVCLNVAKSLTGFNQPLRNNSQRHEQNSTGCANGSIRTVEGTRIKAVVRSK